MDGNFTVEYYAQHYKPIQWEKYEQLWPHIRSFFDEPFFKKGSCTLLDIGIGPGWFESFLETKKVHCARIVGVDVSDTAIAPANEKVTYFLDSDFDIEEKFDVVVCFDAWHLCPQIDLKKFVKENGVLIVSEPHAFAAKLTVFENKDNLFDGWVGETEKSRVVIQK